MRHLPPCQGVGQAGWRPCHATATGLGRGPPETQGSFLSAHPGDMKGCGGFFSGHTQVLTTMDYYLATRRNWYSCMDKLGPHCAVRSQSWKALCCGSVQLV